MAKASYLGMALHQSLSFAPGMLRIPKTQAIFWPGCALLNLDGAILEKTLEILRREEPEIQLACGCCGQPTVFLFPKKAAVRQDKLVKTLKKQGVQRIYTACPNCTLQLGQLEGFTIVPIWPILAKHLTKADVAAPEGRFIWHDPCPTRQEPEQQAAARALLALCGCDCSQPEHTGCQTRCCGNFHMLAATNPEKSAKLRRFCLEEFPQERTIASSCEGCLGAFRFEGRNTRHLLELLFGQSQHRGWRNRFSTTRKV